MTTALITHADCLNHQTPTGHPERVARLESILHTLDAPKYDSLLRVDAPLGTDAQIMLAHPPEHVAAIKAAAPLSGARALDADTHMSEGSLQAAYRAVGGNITAVDMVLNGEATNAFCAVRPPGHHAEHCTPMGFCLFGNVVIAAKHALEHHGLNRVAIVDFDVHHGNGTQDLVWNDERILFCSTHQMPLYPGSGAPHESGAHGNVVNVPLKPYADGADLRRAFADQILPALSDFKPEMVFISAGFDAHSADPLANLEFTESDFSWATEQLCAFAKTTCHDRVVSTLEGGYDLQALAASTAAHVSVLMEQG
ncbi:MAG: histone deacetylase family protein [Rhodobacteraceae bacterium]|nr:histone deacetylase family protein [Paracoccaceae bacterium]